MRRCAVLLRAVNVGGRNRVVMADFAALLASLGCRDVQTYLQSGNATVSSPLEPDDLGRAVAAVLGVSVLVRTAEELATAVDGNPYPAQAAADPTSVHAAFLSGPPAPANVARLKPADFLPDSFSLGDGVLYVHYPKGAGRSKLNNAAVEKLGVVATARNWRSVLALRDLAAG